MVTDEEWKKYQKKVKKVEKQNDKILESQKGLFILTVGIIIILLFVTSPAYAAYSMMTDIKSVVWGGASCGGASNGTTAAQTYDGNIYTWGQASNCELRVNFTHNWTADYCHIRYDSIDGTYQPLGVVWSGYYSGLNTTYVYKNNGWYSRMPRASSTKLYPNVTTSQYLALGRFDTSTVYISEWECFGTSTEVEEPTIVSFTVLPTSGNATLSVNITPDVRMAKLERVVWDYDGGLGSETKYTQMNTSMIKNYSTAGYYTIRLNAYKSTGEVFSASQSISVYNYTLGVTPTPTFTPTPTSTGQSNTTGYIKVKVYDALNNTPINGATFSMVDTDDIGSGWFNVTAASDEYTFNGYSTGGSKSFVIGHKYGVVITKSGYTTTFYIPPSSYTGQEIWSIPIHPTAYIPPSSAFTLYIPLYDSSTTDLIGYKSGTVTISNQSSSWTSTVNSIHDAVTFAGLTPSASYKIDVAIQGYESYTGYFASSSAMGGTYQTYVVNLIPTKLQPSQYTMIISPDTGTVNDTYSISFTPVISNTNVKKVSIKYSTSTSAPLSFMAGSGYSEYAYVAGAWKQWDGSSFSIASSPATGINARFNGLQNPASENVLVTAYITDNNDRVQQINGKINLVSQGKDFIAIWAFDDSRTISGGGEYREQMMRYTSHILDVYTNVWTNTTYDENTYWTANYAFTPNSIIQYYASAYGYPDTPMQSKVLVSGNGHLEYSFHASQPLPLGNVTLYAHITNNGGEVIPSAKVVFTQGGMAAGNCFTNNGGSCYISAYSGLTYTASASAYGYMGATGSINVTNATGNTNVINLVLIKSTPTTRSTYAPTQATPQPTRTFTGYNESNNFTPWGNQVEYECSTHPSGGVLGILMNLMACMGIRGGINQGLALYIVITAGLALYLSRYAKGIGALAGVILGTSGALVMNLIPFWILIFTIIVCGLLFATLLTKHKE